MNGLMAFGPSIQHKKGEGEEPSQRMNEYFPGYEMRVLRNFLP